MPSYYKMIGFTVRGPYRGRHYVSFYPAIYDGEIEEKVSKGPFSDEAHIYFYLPASQIEYEAWRREIVQPNDPVRFADWIKMVAIPNRHQRRRFSGEEWKNILLAHWRKA